MKFTLLFFLFLGLYSCKKDNPPPSVPATSGGLTLDFSYYFDSAKLVFSNAWYANAAGNIMNVENLQYFISDIKLVKSDGSVYTCPGLIGGMGYFSYMDAQLDTFSHIKLTGIPNGNYTGLYFYIGLDTMQNMADMLPNLDIYNNMAWPMGSGGYHFLKMEGHYANAKDTIGYTVHIGEEAHIIKVKQIAKSFTISGGGVVHLPLQMNVAGWFKNPNKYNFTTEGNYTMGNEYNMGQIAANGCNVFNY